MATLQNYKSSEFITAKAVCVLKDGTEMHIWDNDSITLTQFDETGQEHMVIIKEDPVIALVIGGILGAATNVVVLS